jgi:CheY-like chemotaxis protein
LPHKYHIVLHVDDDPDDSAIFYEAVKEAAPTYRCLIADSAASALEILSDRESIPDYIFLDMNMPKMNGLECLRLIKSNHALKHIKVIMYSTASDPIHIKEFRKLGAGFLTKPDRFETLVRHLNEILHDPVKS